MVPLAGTFEMQMALGAGGIEIEPMSFVICRRSVFSFSRARANSPHQLYFSVLFQASEHQYKQKMRAEKGKRQKEQLQSEPVAVETQ